MRRCRCPVLVALVAIGLVGATACSDDDVASDAGIGATRTAESTLEETIGTTATTMAAVETDAEFCPAVEAMTISMGAMIAATLELGFGAISQYFQGAQTPGDAEEFGAGLIETAGAMRASSQAAVDDARVAAAVAPESIAAPLEVMADDLERSRAGQDELVAQYESVIDWADYLSRVGLLGLIPESDSEPSQLTAEQEAAIRTVVEQECGFDLAGIGIGATGDETPPDLADLGTAEQVEDLFKDQTSRQEVARAFADRLGLTAAESECFLEGVDFGDLTAMESEGSEAATERVVAVLSACGIDPRARRLSMVERARAAVNRRGRSER